MLRCVPVTMSSMFSNFTLDDHMHTDVGAVLQIHAKAEMLNPGGSVKDRVALQIVQEAIAEGRLRPGGLLTEGTAGDQMSLSEALQMHHARGGVQQDMQRCLAQAQINWPGLSDFRLIWPAPESAWHGCRCQIAIPERQRWYGNLAAAEEPDPRECL